MPQINLFAGNHIRSLIDRVHLRLTPHQFFLKLHFHFELRLFSSHKPLCFYSVCSTLSPLCALHLISFTSVYTPHLNSSLLLSLCSDFSVFSLSVCCREFISGLRGFSQFYSGLGDALCSKESTVLNSSLCWNGQEMTDK